MTTPQAKGSVPEDWPPPSEATSVWSAYKSGMAMTSSSDGTCSYSSQFIIQDFTKDTEKQRNERVQKDSQSKTPIPLELGVLASGGARGKESACHCAQVWSLGQEDLLEEEMATHSSVLVSKIPCTEEPGGVRRAGHD